MGPSVLDSGELEARLEDLHEASFGWACSCCGWNEAEAEDVLQNAYVKVISGRACFDGRSAFRTWLFGVIRLTAMERRRRLRSLEEKKTRLAAGADGSEGVVEPPDPAETAERARILKDAMKELPPRQQEVLHLVFYEDMTLREAAEVMAVSIGSVRVHYDRAKKKLRALLAHAALEGG